MPHQRDLASGHDREPASPVRHARGRWQSPLRRLRTPTARPPTSRPRRLPPQNPYARSRLLPAEPYAGNPPTAGQTPYGAPQPPAGQNPYGASSYPVAPGGPAPVAGVQPGGLGARFLARLIDGVILIIPNGVLILILDNLIAGILGGVMYIAYYVYLESSRGRTSASRSWG